MTKTAKLFCDSRRELTASKAEELQSDAHSSLLDFDQNLTHFKDTALNLTVIFDKIKVNFN